MGIDLGSRRKEYVLYCFGHHLAFFYFVPKGVGEPSFDTAFFCSKTLAKMSAVVLNFLYPNNPCTFISSFLGRQEG